MYYVVGIDLSAGATKSKETIVELFCYNGWQNVEENHSKVYLHNCMTSDTV